MVARCSEKGGSESKEQLIQKKREMYVLERKQGRIESGLFPRPRNWRNHRYFGGFKMVIYMMRGLLTAPLAATTGPSWGARTPIRQVDHISAVLISVGRWFVTLIIAYHCAIPVCIRPCGLSGIWGYNILFINTFLIIILDNHQVVDRPEQDRSQKAY